MIRMSYNDTHITTDDSSLGKDLFLDLIDAAKEDSYDYRTTEYVQVNGTEFMVRDDDVRTINGEIPNDYLGYAFFETVEGSDL